MVLLAGCGGGQLRVVRKVADHGGIADHRIVARRDETARRKIEILAIGPVQRRGSFGGIGNRCRRSDRSSMCGSDDEQGKQQARCHDAP